MLPIKGNFQIFPASLTVCGAALNKEPNSNALEEGRTEWEGGGGGVFGASLRVMSRGLGLEHPLIALLTRR